MVKKRITSVDVARKAGAAQSMVSRVLNGNGRFSPETCERVLTAAIQLSYKPNALARSLTLINRAQLECLYREPPTRSATDGWVAQTESRDNKPLDIYVYNTNRKACPSGNHIVSRGGNIYKIELT